MQLVNSITCIWELKWSPNCMTDLPMVITSLHQTFVSSSHTGYYQSTGTSLSSIQHLFFLTLAGPLAQQPLQCFLHKPVNSTCELQSRGTRRLGQGHVTLRGIHFVDLRDHNLAHFLHELSLLMRCLWDPAGLLAWLWVKWPKEQSIKLYTSTTVASPAVVTLDLP